MKAVRKRGRPPKGQEALTHKQIMYIRKELESRKKDKRGYAELAKRFKVDIKMINYVATNSTYGGKELATQPETLFKKKVQKDLDKLPNTWHFKADNRALRGIPDMILCVNGLFIGIELKKDMAGMTNNAPRHKLQRWVRTEIRTKGKGISFVAYPEIWPDILAKIKLLAIGDADDQDYFWPST